MQHNRPLLYGILLLTIGFYCLDYFFRISPSLILPQLMAQYHTTPLGIGLFASLFYLGYVLFQLPCGLLLDRFSVKWTIIGMASLCTFSFIGFIFAHIFLLGLFLRFILGAASAASFISVLYLARLYLPPKFFGLISGITIAAGTLAASVIQIINAYLIQYLSWQIVISLFSLWGIIIAALLLFMPNSSNQKPHLYNPLPFFTLIKELFKLLLKPRFFLNGVMGGLFYLPTSLLTAVWGISFFSSAYHLDTTAASSVIFMIFLGWGVGSPLLGLLGGYIHRSHWISALGALLAAGISAVMLFESAWLQQGIFTAAFLFGLCSSTQVLVWKNFNALCPPELSGVGIAATNMLIMFIVSVSHSIVGYFINMGYQHTHHVGISNYLMGLEGIPWILLTVAILTLMQLQKPQQEKANHSKTR